MSNVLRAALLVVVLSLVVVTSQPFSQPDPGKHSEFKWNSRKIGNKKVATLTIRKDEERDRRSIPLVDGADDELLHIPGQRHRPHRHHHGEGAKAMWLADDTSTTERHAGGRSREDDYSRGADMKAMTPLHAAETGLEEGRRVRHNDVHPESRRDENHMPSLPQVLEEVGIHLNPSHLKNKTTRKGNTRRGRNGRGKTNRRNRTSKRNRKTKKKNKKRKGCRRLKGEQRRACFTALRLCRGLKKKAKKRCRADALNVAVQESSATAGQDDARTSATQEGSRPEDVDTFSFLSNMTEMIGSEACHYHYLKKCCSEVGLFVDRPDNKMPVVKCHFRKEFLKCMLNQRRGTCDPTFHTRGDMTSLRNKIKEFVWTPSSCLISDVIEG